MEKQKSKLSPTIIYPLLAQLTDWLDQHHAPTIDPWLQLPKIKAAVEVAGLSPQQLLTSQLGIE